MSKILITGGAGHIGGALAEHLLNAGHNITVIDDLSAGHCSVINGVDFIRGNVNNYDDISSVMLCNRFNYVFHYAAIVGVKKTLDNPMLVLDDIKGLSNVLSLCKNTKVKRIFFSSSSEVYGESMFFPQNEDTTPINSRLPYAVVKSVGETMIKAFYHEHGLNYTIYRFFNTYGARQRNDFVIPKFIDLALSGKDITIYGDGMQTRTFLHISDNIKITALPVINNTDCFINDTVNIGNPVEVSMNSLAEIIVRLSNSTSKIIHINPLKEGDMPRRMPDTSKADIKITWNRVPLEEGINEIIKLKK